MAVTAGNTFVLKPSERDPGAAMALADLAQQAGLPKCAGRQGRGLGVASADKPAAAAVAAAGAGPARRVVAARWPLSPPSFTRPPPSTPHPPRGVLNVVHGTHDVVNAILDHPDIRAVSFVGSDAAGRHVYSRAAASGKRVQVRAAAAVPRARAPPVSAPCCPCSLPCPAPTHPSFLPPPSPPLAPVQHGRQEPRRGAAGCRRRRHRQGHRGRRVWRRGAALHGDQRGGVCRRL
jgi:hypothetical protein